MEELVSFSTRIRKDQEKRLMEIVAATTCEVSRSEITRQALDNFFAQLAVCPSMLAGYDPKKDKSARRLKKQCSPITPCNTGE